MSCDQCPNEGYCRACGSPDAAFAASELAAADAPAPRQATTARPQGVAAPTLEQMAVAALRGLYEAVNSRETEVPVDENDDSPSAPTKKIRGVVHQDEDDPCVLLTGDFGPGSGTIYYGTMGKPLGRHTHFGNMAGRQDHERNFAAFVRGLYSHFQDPESFLDIPMSEVAIATGDYRVEYAIDGFPGEYSAGPYPDLPTANGHLRDIAGYEGVRDARVVPVYAGFREAGAATGEEGGSNTGPTSSSGSINWGSGTGPLAVDGVEWHPTWPAAPEAPLDAQVLLDLAGLCLKFARVERITRHEDGRRPETDSDHTVMLAVLACAYAARCAPQLDRGKIAQFSVVHDLVEAHSGDVPSLEMSAATREAKERAERASLGRIRAETAALPWVAATIAEYESLVSEEARFVKIVDKVLPKLTHLLNDGAALREYGFDAAQTHASHLRQRQTLAAEYPQKEALALYDLVVAECARRWGFAAEDRALDNRQ